MTADGSFALPTLSVVVVFHDMRREAPRTLHSLSRAYQRGIDDLDYEVIAVDNGSRQPLEADDVAAHGPQFRYLRHETASPSPTGAINRAAALARGTHVTVCIDGARMLSPGVLRHTALACRLSRRPVVSVLGWHLGPKPQNESILEGYDRDVEDALLAGCGWQHDGYRLFDVSSLARSAANGWFLPMSESNCVTVSRPMFDELGGFEPRFETPGGGLVNLDFYRRACLAPDADLIVLLGEGSFHQIHGGVATNVPEAAHPRERFRAEYRAIRGEDYRNPTTPATYLGTLPAAARRFVRHSLDRLDGD